MSRDAVVLNRLAARLRSASAGYRKAGADGPGLSDVFAAAADAHDRTAGSLESMAQALGGADADAPDPSRHAWADLPRAVIEGPRATAKAVEGAEAELLADFQAAMDDDAVSGPIRDAVLHACAGVQAGRDRALQRLRALES